MLSRDCLRRNWRCDVASISFSCIAWFQPLLERLFNQRLYLPDTCAKKLGGMVAPAAETVVRDYSSLVILSYLAAMSLGAAWAWAWTFTHGAVFFSVEFTQGLRCEGLQKGRSLEIVRLSVLVTFSSCELFAADDSFTTEEIRWPWYTPN